MMDDCISRQVVLAVCHDLMFEKGADDSQKITAQRISAATANTPSVKLTVPRGERKYYHKQNRAVCLNCSFERDLDADFGKAIACPNCGADMREGKGDE